MATASQLIDSRIKHLLQQSSTATVWSNPRLREKARYGLIEVCNRTHTAAPYWWKLGYSGSVSLTSGDGTGTMPSDFAHFGLQGHLYISGQEKRGTLGYRPPDAFVALQKSYTGQRAYPSHYTLRGQTSAGVAQVEVWPTPSQNLTLLAEGYVKRCPAIMDAPGPPDVADSGSAGNPNGAYTYRVTFVTAAGETDAGGASSSVTVDTNQISVTNIPTDPLWKATARKLYRTVAGGSSHLLVTTISDNTTTTYTDNIADGSLGAAHPTPLTGVTGLEVFPEDFHWTCIGKGLDYYLMRRGGDLRDNKVQEEWESDMRRMWGEFKQGQNVVQGVAPYRAAQGFAGGADYWRHRFSGV